MARVRSRAIAIQQWRTLAILANDSPFLADAAVLAEHTRSSDDRGAEEQQAHDDKGENPLQSDHFGGELCQGECCASGRRVSKEILALEKERRDGGRGPAYTAKGWRKPRP